MRLIRVTDRPVEGGGAPAPRLEYKGRYQDNPGTPNNVWVDAIMQHCSALEPHEKIFAEQVFKSLISKIAGEELTYREAIPLLRRYLDLIGAFSEEQRSSIEMFFGRMFLDEPLDHIPLPILDNRDQEENRIAVQHVLDSIPPEGLQGAALKFKVPDADDNDVPVTISPRAWDQWRLVHLISTNQPHLSFPGREEFYSCEIFAFLHGNRDESGVTVSSIEVPYFTVRGDTVTFGATSRINGRTVMGTAHVHPGGSEWSTLSDLDFSGFINGGKMYCPNILFNAVQAKRAFLAPFAAQGSAFEYVKERAGVISGRGICPVESLRPLRAPIVTVPFKV